jgi:predicted lipoprotein with Yx(FWY)xxD motif
MYKYLEVLLIVFMLQINYISSFDVNVVTSGALFDIYGEFLTNSTGFTLYMYNKDNRLPIRTCFGSCRVNWPIVTPAILGYPTGDSNINASRLGVINGSDGIE